MLDPDSQKISTKSGLTLYGAHSSETYVKELNCVPIFNEQEAIKLVKYGLSGLESEGTNNNKKSSRGHACIIFLLVNVTKKSMSSKFLVDLAGVELYDQITLGMRVSSDLVAKICTESTNINTDLSALRQLIDWAPGLKNTAGLRNTRLPSLAKSRVLTQSLLPYF